MAKINTTRPEAAPYNGREARFVHDVTAADGPAFNPLVDQVIVNIDGNDLYFFANEVRLTDEEAETAEERRDEAQEAADKAKRSAREHRSRKQESFAQYRRGADEKKSKGGDKPSEDPRAAPANPNPAPQPTVTQSGAAPIEPPLPSGAQPQVQQPEPNQPREPSKTV